MRRSLVMLGVLAAFALVAGPVAADPETPDPDPVTPAAPPGGVDAQTTGAAGTAEEYCNELANLSADGAGPHTINLTAGFSLVGASCVTDPTYTGSQPLTINGNGFTIDGGNVSRILDFDSTADLTVNDLTAVNGAVSGGGSGGAINANGNMTVNRSTFDGNDAGGDGGAIDADDLLTITQSTFTNNNADDDGGAVDTSDEDSSVLATKSTFAGNSSGNDGGAIEAEQHVTLINSTVENNTGVEDIINSEFSGITVVYVTISGNTLPAGDGVLDTDPDNGALLQLTSFGTVIANTLGGGVNCSAEFTGVTSSYSHSSDASCGFVGTGDLENAPDPQLGALGANGGPTPTMLPASTSPLLDQIPVAACAAGQGIVDDQRGVARPQGTGCDIGAVEVLVPIVEPTFTG